MSKRRNGEGSISQRKSDGRWVGRISLPDGSRKAFYGKTRQAVDEKVTEAIRNREKGISLQTNERVKLKIFLELDVPVVKQIGIDDLVEVVRQVEQCLELAARQAREQTPQAGD